MFFSPNVLPVWNPFLKWKQKKNRERKRTATKPSGQVLPPFAKARKFVCENPELLWTTADPRTHPQATSLAPIHGTSWSCPSSARPWRARALRESISGLSRAAAFFEKKEFGEGEVVRTLRVSSLVRQFPATRMCVNLRVIRVGRGNLRVMSELRFPRRRQTSYWSSARYYGIDTGREPRANADKSKIDFLVNFRLNFSTY